MAEVEIIDEEAFRKECEVMDEHCLIAQVLFQQGGAHALRFLYEKGATQEHAEQMLEQMERNAGIVSQIAAARGIDLPIDVRR